jgi:hypothetical protein
VREASPETVVVADGFSCRSQIEQGGTGRRALHVAEVIGLAREHGKLRAYPERAFAPPQPSGRRRLARATVAVGAAAALAGAAFAAARA